MKKLAVKVAEAVINRQVVGIARSRLIHAIHVWHLNVLLEKPPIPYGVDSNEDRFIVGRAYERRPIGRVKILAVLYSLS